MGGKERSEPPKCETCPYWARHPGAFVGQCRKYAPRPGSSEAAAAWRQTGEGEGCGEHPDFPAYLRSLGRGAGDDVMPAIDEAEAWLRRRFRECRHWPVDSLMELARALFPEPVVRMARTRLPLVYRNFDVSWGGGEAP